MKEPQDHLGKNAVQREAEGVESVDVEAYGETFSLPGSPEDWPLDAMEAFEQQRVLQWASQLLGTDDWRRLKTAIKRSTGKQPAVRDLTPLMERVAELYGFDELGN